MRINNSTTDHAIRMLLILAKRNKTVSSAEISRMLNISQRYLLSVGARLRDAGVITVSHGSSGGYKLILDPAEVSFYDIIVLFQGEMEPRNWIDPELTEFATLQGVNAAFDCVESRIEGHLKGLTLQFILDQTADTERASYQ